MENKRKYIDKEKEYNQGIALLRMLMCFEVILCHCWYLQDTSVLFTPLVVLMNYAVPVFMFVSFFLT